MLRHIFRENWSYLVDRFTLNDRYLGRLIPSITGRFSTDLKVDEVQLIILLTNLILLDVYF
jgi:hypothetical protein